MAVSITFSLKNVGEEKAAEEKSCQDYEPKYKRNQLLIDFCLRVVKCLDNL